MRYLMTCTLESSSSFVAGRLFHYVYLCIIILTVTGEMSFGMCLWVVILTVAGEISHDMYPWVVNLSVVGEISRLMYLCVIILTGRWDISLTWTCEWSCSALLVRYLVASTYVKYLSASVSSSSTLQVRYLIGFRLPLYRHHSWWDISWQLPVNHPNHQTR